MAGFVPWLYVRTNDLGLRGVFARDCYGLENSFTESVLVFFNFDFFSLFLVLQNIELFL